MTIYLYPLSPADLRAVAAGDVGSVRAVQLLGFKAGATVIDDDGEALVRWTRQR